MSDLTPEQLRIFAEIPTNEIKDFVTNYVTGNGTRALDRFLDLSNIEDRRDFIVAVVQSDQFKAQYPNHELPAAFLDLIGDAGSVVDGVRNRLSETGQLTVFQGAQVGGVVDNATNAGGTVLSKIWDGVSGAVGSGFKNQPQITSLLGALGIGFLANKGLQLVFPKAGFLGKLMIAAVAIAGAVVSAETLYTTYGQQGNGSHATNAVRATVAAETGAGATASVTSHTSDLALKATTDASGGLTGVTITRQSDGASIELTPSTG